MAKAARVEQVRAKAKAVSKRKEKVKDQCETNVKQKRRALQIADADYVSKKSHSATNLHNSFAVCQTLLRHILMLIMLRSILLLGTGHSSLGRPRSLLGIAQALQR